MPKLQNMIKKLLILAGIVILLTSCQNKPSDRYITSSSEIDLLRDALEDYENGNWDEWMMQYADSAKIYQNSWDSYKSPVQTRDNHKKVISQMSSYSFDKKDLFFEQVIDDRGRTWVNFWGLWRGTLKVNDKIIEIPVHLNILFEEGKVLNEYGYWNSAMLNEELKKAQLAASNSD